MGQSSAKMYIPDSQEEISSYKVQRKFNTNVICIEFHILKDKTKVALGDPIFCKQCIAALSSLSNVKFAEDESAVWDCEFCGKKNDILIDKEEIPTNDDLMYVL
mmetsp:Transcript_145937/g.206776  ORF Transcript_145937/g.206776 Transcript_145937/m.206776 type:complete len:104 (+) Transcript_145937:26-337(+)